MQLRDMRRDYGKSGLRRRDLCQDPIEQLERWLEEASREEILDATAMTLATVDEAGQPSQRIVLLKQLDPAGLVFFTNLNSKKARDIAVNHRVSTNFAWLALERQVRVEGTASRLRGTEALRYFATRPKDSQIAAWASNQSHPIQSRQILVTAFEQMRRKFSEGEIPLPSFWGGYRIKPSKFEFWQGGSARLHDRFEYTESESGWEINRLAP